MDFYAVTVKTRIELTDSFFFFNTESRTIYFEKKPTIVESRLNDVGRFRCYDFEGYSTMTYEC